MFRNLNGPRCLDVYTEVFKDACTFKYGVHIFCVFCSDNMWSCPLTKATLAITPSIALRAALIPAETALQIISPCTTLFPTPAGSSCSREYAAMLVAVRTVQTGCFCSLCSFPTGGSPSPQKQRAGPSTFLCKMLLKLICDSFKEMANFSRCVQ